MSGLRVAWRVVEGFPWAEGAVVRRTVAVGLIGVLAVGVLVGCGAGGGTEPEGLSASPPVTASPTPTPSPTPTEQVFTDELGVVYDFSDPDLGIYFEDVPFHLSGDEADVHNAIALWVREAWRSAVTNQVSPYIYESSAAAVIESMETSAENNTSRGNTLGGVHRVAITGIGVDGETATGRVCRDYREGTFENPDGPDDPADVGFGEPILAEYTLVDMGGGVWWIESIARDGTC